MSLGAVAQSQPASGSSSAPPTSSEQQPQGQSQQPGTGQNSAEPFGGAKQEAPRGLGDNGGPDWRAMLAGEDTKFVETLSRYQSPTDFAKAFQEQRAALSKRAEPARLPDNPNPEQVAEWRRGLGLPEVKGDKAEEFLAAYKLEFPKGYEASEVEKGMITDFAKQAYDKGWQPGEVKGAVDFFLQQQTAMQQAVNRVAVDNQRKWQTELREELGPREYEAQQAAAEAWLKEKFDGEILSNFLTAQLPGGGYLGDHPAFFKMVSQLAMGDGYTDRIVGNTLESSTGKPLAQQQSEIENLQFSDKAAYDAAMQPGGRYEQILGARIARGELDNQGNEVRRRRA